MAGYARTNTADIQSGTVVKSAPINAELNAIVTAFAFSGGHNHDGSSTEGAYVGLIADTDALNKVVVDTSNNRVGFFSEVSSAAVEQVRIQDGAILPVTDNDIDLGASGTEFKDLYLDGTAHIDTLDIDDNATVAGTLGVTGATTLAGILSLPDGSASAPSITNTGDTDCGLYFSAADTLAFTAGGTAQFTMADGAIAPVTDNDIDLGTSSLEFKDGYFDGTLYTDAINLNGTAITSTAAELNILDGVTSTAAELSIMDGDTSATSTTLADADRVVVNDAGTMKQVALTDFETYFESALDTLSNVTSLGTLTTLTVDNVIVNGTTIGHTDDTDLITLADGVATVAGELSVTTLDINGTNVTSTAAELNILDGVTSTATELNYLDITTLGTSEASKAVTVDSSGDLVIPDSDKFKFGAGSDMQLYHDGSNSYITNATGALKLATETSGIAVTIGHSTSEVTIGDNLTVTGNLTVSGTQTVVDTVTMNAQNAIVFEGATADSNETTLSIVDPTSDHTQYLINQGGYIPVLAAATTTAITSTPAELNIMDGGTSATSTTVADADRVVMNDNGTMVQVAVTDLAAYFDDEITAMPNLTSVGTLSTLTVDNVIINGTTIGHTGDTDLMTLASGVLTVAGEVDATSLDISGNADIDGTTNLDAVDIDGVVQIDGATTFGVDDTGVDVKFFGATSGAYLLWDESADKLLTAGGAVVDIVKDKLLIGGTAVTTTAAELNILDGKSFVDEDDMSSDSATAIASQQSIKAYVDANRNVTGLNATGAELNTVADASAISIDTSTAVANNDAILMYDNSGTAIKYFDVDLLDTYYAGTTSTLTNKTLTAPKFADGGFIADANGNELIMLQTASSAVNQLEITNSASGGSIVVGASGDDSNIDIDISPKGTGEVNIAAGNLNYAGTAITSTGAELNLTDGSSSGTIVNSKAVIYGGSGEVNATTLQIAGTSINATAAELNIMDGNTSATSTTLADADRLVTNDAGTMKQVALTDLKTYLTSAGFSSDDPTALAIALG